MRLWRAISLIFAGFLLGLPVWAQQHETIHGQQAVANEVLVKLRAGVRLEADGYIVRTHDIRAARELDNRGLMHLRSGSKSAARLVEELKTDPDVEYVEPNYVVHTTAAGSTPAAVIPNDGLFPQEWGLRNTGQNGGLPNADIAATLAWSITTGTPAVVVGVVDTGLDYTHPDLSANVWTAPTAFTVQFGPGDSITCPAGSHGYDAIYNTCTPLDPNSHGTHVSGTIGAAGNNGLGVTGVNWTASLMGLRFLDATGSGTVANAVRAIEFAVQAKAALGSAANLRVLSNSWGGAGASQALLNAINDANTAGMLFVVAAGNNSANLDSTTFYPASYRTPNLIAVAATDSRDALASFSNYGRNSVDLGAPGVNIASTILNSNYATMSGTSMATPHVAGAAALVLAACTTLNTAGLRSALLNNVDAVAGLANTTITGGRLNVYKAVQSCAAGATPPKATPGFTLNAASASVALTAGGASAATTIGATGTGGFTGVVTLGVTGLPAGVTPKFTPASVAAGGTASLALTAAATAAAGTFKLTITGISGTLSNTATVTLTVSAKPAFTLQITPPTASVRRGAAALFAISATASGNFSGSISLSISGLPANSSTTFSQAANGALTMRVATTPQTPVSSYAIRIVGTGTSGGFASTQTATATLTVTN